MDPVPHGTPWQRFWITVHWFLTAIFVLGTAGAVIVWQKIICFLFGHETHTFPGPPIEGGPETYCIRCNKMNPYDYGGWSQFLAMLAFMTMMIVCAVAGATAVLVLYLVAWSIDR
jgi:hypothetical protein